MSWLAVTGLTLRELRSSKLTVLPLTVVVALVLVAANIRDVDAFGEQLLRGSWSGLAFMGSLLAILVASSAVSSEIERGTMLLLAARPISRTGIVVGKALGITVYLAACVVVWSVALALGLGSQVDQGAGVAFVGGLLVLAPVLLTAAVSLTISVLFPARGAIGASVALWLAAAIVAAIPLEAVRRSNVDRVDAAQDVLGWVLPSARLGELRDLPLGGAVDWGAYGALLVVVAWLAAAAIALQLRGSLARSG